MTMTKSLDDIKSSAFDAFIPYFDDFRQTNDDDTLDFDARYILDHLDFEPTIASNDNANPDDIAYAMTIQLSIQYDACPLDIIILNPHTYPIYFISIDSAPYTPMI